MDNSFLNFKLVMNRTFSLKIYYQWKTAASIHLWQILIFYSLQFEYYQNLVKYLILQNLYVKLSIKISYCHPICYIIDKMNVSLNCCQTRQRRRRPNVLLFILSSYGDGNPQRFRRGTSHTNSGLGRGDVRPNGHSHGRAQPHRGWNEVGLRSP